VVGTNHGEGGFHVPNSRWYPFLVVYGPTLELKFITKEYMYVKAMGGGMGDAEVRPSMQNTCP